jgi:hypothetical protein
MPGDVDAAWLASARHLHATGIFPALQPGTRGSTRHQFGTQALRRQRQAGGDPWPGADLACTSLHHAMHDIGANTPD